MTETVSDERLKRYSEVGTLDQANIQSMARELLALRTPPQNTDGEAVAWEGYWPGAGSVDSVTKVTHHRHVMESWHLSGAEITPLVPASALSAMKAERDTLPADSTDKAQAWDAIAEKNATIAALKAERDALATAAMAVYAKLASETGSVSILEQEQLGDALRTLQGDAK